MFNIYLVEIKNRLILILLSWSFLFGISYLNKEILLFLTIKPNINLDENFYFIATDAVEILNSYLSLAYFISFQFSAYVIIFHSISFIYPALYKLEATNLNMLFSLSFFMWVISNLLFNLITFPVCWNFFLSFQNTSIHFVNIFLELRVEKYLEKYFQIYYLTVFLFQVLLFFFIFLNNLISIIDFVKKTRKVTYFMLIIAATLLTPPDVVSQLVVFFYLIVQYEIGIVIIILKNFFINSVNS